ncbi:MAG: hypothetical protein CMJ25_12680 [Phycisphaerae bacterium]|nr:hypothetical protein [Phycisphaerae bacterium]|tara:strand:+ start:81 stop:275 length:195 start_codon:yes stop_codon:yes gene_type:complete
MKELKIGQEIDGRTIDHITMDEDTRDMVVRFGNSCDPYSLTIVVKHNESIDKVLNHKWETQDAG